MSAPSGRGVPLSYGDYEAEVVEVGAGLRALRKQRRELVDGYAPTQMCSGGRGQVLTPWPNRVADGRYEFGGTTYQLPLSEAAAGNAIHGLTRWVNWSLLDRSPASARWGYSLHPQPGYPFELDLTVDYTLSDKGLRVQTAAVNVGAVAAPYGQGAHPYLTVGRRIDECELTLSATTKAASDQRGLPGDPEPVIGGPFDFAEARLIRDTTFDDPFGGVTEGQVALLRDPDSGRSAALCVDSTYRWVQLFSGDKLPDRPRCALAVEPMTCPVNAFNSGVDLIILEPGATHQGTFAISGS
ncbi:MAG: aldose 1-epimerase family protein [Nocardioidaceae bacterium]|nr:aldose 1-epimerase family protein [Nocardioidaceae bacterium]